MMDLATLILAKQHIMHCCRKMSQKTFPRFLLGFSLLSAPLAFKFLILDGCAVGMDWLVGRLDCRRRRRRRRRRTLPETLAGKHLEACTKWQTPIARSKW